MGEGMHVGEDAGEQGRGGWTDKGSRSHAPGGQVLSWSGRTCDYTHPILGGQERLPKDLGFKLRGISQTL